MPVQNADVPEPAHLSAEPQSGAQRTPELTEAGTLGRQGMGPGLALLAGHGRGTDVRLMTALQRGAGNRAVGQLIHRVHALQREPPPNAATPGSGPATPAAGATGAAVPATTTGLIVDDAVADLRPEQMHRADFLVQARTAALEGAHTGAGPLAASADTEVEGTAARYGAQPAAQMEATVRAEVVGAAGATKAAGLVNAIRDASNNEARGRLSTGVSDKAADAVGAAVDAVSNAASAVANLLFKSRGDTTATSGPGDVARARSQLGRGDTVPGGLRAEVEQVTGQDLSDVRVHTGGPAQTMAADLGARAFTVGRDIVVAAGEPATGTLHGDALLAHELAHAAQQGRSGIAESAEKSDAGGGGDLAETAADDVSADAVVGLWTGMRQRLSDAGSTVAGRVKSGLRLQRCGGAKIDPKKEELNKKVLEGMATANAPKSASSGIHYPYNYQKQYPDEWKKLGEPKDGYADPKYWNWVAFMHWVRKPGVSASKAMDAWFGGPTIADCAAVATASEVNALRAALGDDRFDKLFGGAGAKPMAGPDGTRVNLEIGQGEGSSVVADLMRETKSRTDAGPPGKRNVNPGEWHYFANHPAYPRRHPTEYWRGENALYKGEEGGVQMWTGFGATESEDGMNGKLVARYNDPISTDDADLRKGWYEKYGDAVANWPDKLKQFYGDFPNEIDVPKMILAGGGFDKSAGKELDPAKVAALKARVDQ